MSFFFGFRRPEGGSTILIEMLRRSEFAISALSAARRAVALRNAAAAAVRQGFGPAAQNACTAQKRRPAVRGPGACMSAKRFTRFKTKGHPRDDLLFWVKPPLRGRYLKRHDGSRVFFRILQKKRKECNKVTEQRAAAGYTAVTENDFINNRRQTRWESLIF